MRQDEVEGLYRRYYPVVLRRAWAMLREEQAARDAAQEVFVRVLRTGGDFRGDSSPVTWLYRITTNHCLNLISSEARRRELLREALPPDDGPAPPPAIDDSLSVAAVLRRVPEELREVAVYHYLDQMDHQEIADLMGVSRRTIGYRLEAFRQAARAVAGALVPVNA
jgi:RNA polymerase sigma-70 factor (ECF subfamily)